MSTNLSNDQAVVYLVSGYSNATDIVNKTLQDESPSVPSNVSDISSPWVWLTHPYWYEKTFPIGSTKFCDTGNCVKDCQDLTQLFSGSAPSPFVVCTLFANVSRTLPNREIWTADEASQLTSFGFGDKSRGSLDAIATAVTTCLNDVCIQNPKTNHCAQSCSRKNLLINGSTPSFGGVSDCLQQVCSLDLSFADFDLAGIGVSRTAPFHDYSDCWLTQVMHHRLPYRTSCKSSLRSLASPTCYLCRRGPGKKVCPNKSAKAGKTAKTNSLAVSSSSTRRSVSS